MFPIAILTLTLTAEPAAATGPLPEAWDYADAMRAVAARFHGRPGVVLHVGDSITYSSPYGQWARAGKGKTPEDEAVLEWMHTARDDDSDGWWLARFDHPDGGRSHTACGGLRLGELLAGGKQGLPALSQLLDAYRLQVVVLMIGTGDVTAGRPLEMYRAELAQAVKACLDRGIVLVLSTIPPHPGRFELAQSFNAAIRELAEREKLPMIDFEREILIRRRDDWNGTLLNRDDVHPTAAVGDVKPTSEPTPENLRTCGYLLRGWLSVRKLAEVKRRVLDAPTAPAVTRGAAAPRGEAVTLPVTRDTWFSNVGQEADCNLGGSSRLKVKSIQEMSLVDIDPAALRGRAINAATLHLRLVGDEILRRVTVGTFSAEWVEGTSPSYAPQQGSSTYRSRCHPATAWCFPGSDLCEVVLGRGGSLWRMADASPPDGQGWQQVPVDPAVVAARVAGVSYGLFVFDDTGSEWTRQGERFTLRLFPNRFVHSREAGADKAPYLTVYLGEADVQGPSAPTELSAETADLPASEARFTWVTPPDVGAAGTIGFFVHLGRGSLGQGGRPVPRYLVPAAGKPGETVSMHLRDLELDAGSPVELTVRAVDGAGNVGPAATIETRVSDRVAAQLAGTPPANTTTSREQGNTNPQRKQGDAKPREQGSGEPRKQGNELPMLPKLAGAEVAIIDALDKVHPVTGEMTPPQPQRYLAANHLWNAQDRTVHLHGARNEHVDFQVLLRRNVRGMTAKLEFGEPSAAPRDVRRSALSAAIGRYRYINCERGPLPDPIVPLSKPLDVPTLDDKIAGQTNAALLAETYVPHDAAAGDHLGKLRLTAGKESLELKVVFTVWDFTLPDFLSFIPEMNCYGLPANERDYYRLAHEHRTALNRVPYYQNGRVAPGCAPGWDGRRLDFDAWDARFGPLLDGTAFDDLPRRGVPLSCFYLPLHENWPTPIEGNYNGDFWADRAFPAAYRAAFVAASRQLAEHCDARGWHDTLFQCFLNGKNSFKQEGWSHGSSPWLLDEPASFQDYWALRYFGRAFHEGLNQGGGKARMLFRCDISRPQWQRDALDDVLDDNVVGGSFR
ncbi:MAG TPA: SGNH/GDSL hydrolase family protein, partial [Pirellulales bacterium]|nr:SGNH/GDSL hydrolase family protein [Pirellulales bacterium]